MRKIMGLVLVGLGAFLVMAGVIGTVYAPSAVKKTPLGVDSTTVLAGEADRLGAGMRPIYALSITKTDDEASTDDVAVFTNVACAVFDEGQDPQECADGDDENALSLGTDIFATDRVTAEAVDFEDAEPHEGVINKWPFDAEKETYPYWDGLTASAVDAVYDRTEDLDGLETYVYRIEIVDAPIEIAEGTPGTYSTLKEIYVDPRTGAIMKQTEEQERFLDSGDQALDLTLAFTDEQVAENVADAKDNVASLDLITKTVPLIGFIGGAVLLLLGAFLLFGASRAQGRRSAE